jgi:hypothetical protein
MHADWHHAWSQALDAFELDVAATEALLADDHLLRDHALADPWAPPAGLGPLPLDLRPRADGILARQLTAADAVVKAISMNRRQAAATARIETGQGAARPAYIDCAL